MAQLRISDEAKSDMAEIWFYIARDSVSAADRVNASFHERFAILADNPMMGRSRPELASDLRSFPVGSYLIFYRPIEDGVEILRVVHGARNIEAMF